MNQQDMKSEPQPPEHSTDYVPYPQIDPNDIAPPPPNCTSVPATSQQSPIDLPRSSAAPEVSATTMPPESNPYVSPAPVPASSMKSEFLLNSIPSGSVNFYFYYYYLFIYLLLSCCVCMFYLVDTMDSVKDVLGKWGKKAAEASKKAGDLAGNTWQHCMCDDSTLSRV